MTHTTIKELYSVKQKLKTNHANHNSHQSNNVSCTAGDDLFFKEENYMPEIIGIDNGNYNTKTLNTTLASGVIEYETDPFIPNGKIKYKGNILSVAAKQET